jgi:hypothetical protein
MKNFYKLNKKYIDSFINNVSQRFMSNDKRTDVSFLRSILEEVTSLFRKFGGQISNKNQIPKETDYPDSTKYNDLVTSIGFDIDKLYNSQKIIEEDINNLIKFNSYQREKSMTFIENLQQSVYTSYIKNKANVGKGLEKVESFTSIEGMDPISNGVKIDTDRGILTLSSDTAQYKTVDLPGVQLYFNQDFYKPSYVDPNNPYPNNKVLSVGSHWKKSKDDVHFVNTTDPTILTKYRSMMIDDPTNPVGVGICEFETVVSAGSIGEAATSSFIPVLSKVKRYLSDSISKSESLIYIDGINSLQARYLNSISKGTNAKTFDGFYYPLPTKFKLVIPFTNDILTNEILIDFAALSRGTISVNWSTSFAYSTDEKRYSFISGKDVGNNAFVCFISSFIKLGRIELTFSIDEQAWEYIPFMMAWYVYSHSHSHEIGGTSSTLVQFDFKKTFDVFVESEPDKTSEANRAVNVIKG